jgi:3-dehydroquinate dehydratase-2
MKILVVNGPSINMLGVREPELYGAKSYTSLVALINSTCKRNNIFVDIFQSNHEGEIIDKIQSAYEEEVDGIIINAAGYSHTSVAILDALRAANKPTVEVHITDHQEREEYRRFSYISTYAIKTISGWGISGYVYAIMFIKSYLEKAKAELLPGE